MPASNRLRLAFLGHACVASVETLAAMLDAGLTPTRIILAGAPGPGPGAIERLAAGRGVPLAWVRSADEVSTVLRASALEVAVAACFPWRLPRAARQIPPLGILNIHPSLLPAGRGPQPVFWTLRRGEQTTGVTVHRMDSGFDTGPIAAQETVPVPTDIRATDLENRLMARGAGLLAEVLPGLESGEVQPRPQATTGVSLAPVPSPADWTMIASLPAAWAWRFARGVACLGGPLTAIAGGEAIPVAEALDWSPDERLPEAVMEQDDGTVRVRFSPGWVRFRRGGEGVQVLPLVTSPVRG